MDDKLYHYRARVTCVVDGDTVDVMFDMGLDTFGKRRLQLKGIDAPKILWMKEESEEFQRGMAAREFVRERVIDKQVWVKTYKDKTGKYGRYLGDVFFQDEDGKHVNISTLLLEEGLADKYEE